MFKAKEIAGKSSGVVGDVRHVRVGDPLQARARLFGYNRNDLFCLRINDQHLAVQ